MSPELRRAVCVSYAPTAVAEFSHKPSMRPTRKPHAFIRIRRRRRNCGRGPCVVPWWRLTFGIVVLGGLAWVFTKSTLDGAYASHVADGAAAGRGLWGRRRSRYARPVAPVDVRSQSVHAAASSTQSLVVVVGQCDM